MKLWKSVLCRVPRELPRGLDELNQFIDDLLTHYNLPKNISYQRMIATMIQHLPQSRRRASMHDFFQSIKRAEATEAAFWKLQDLKLEEQEQKQAATPKPESPPEAIESTDQGMGSTA